MSDNRDDLIKGFDTQAIHGKLDELLRATKNARSDVAKLDEQEPEEIDVHRKLTRADD